MGVLLRVMMTELQRMDLHLGIRAAGVDGEHDFVRIQELSIFLIKSRSRVWCVPLSGSVNSVDGPKFFVDRWKSSGGPVVIMMIWGPSLSVWSMIGVYLKGFVVSVGAC